MSWWWALAFSVGGVLVGGIMGITLIAILAARSGGEDDG